MKNSKLIEVLSVFNKEEIQRLGLFLQSPFFSGKSPKKEKFYLLYLSLVKRHPSYQESDINKNNIYAEVFSADIYRVGRLEKVMSSLFKKIEQFIIVEKELQPSQKFNRLINLTNFYRSRGLFRLYDSGVNNLEKHQKSLKRKDNEDLHCDYIVQQAIADYKSVYNHRTDDVNLPNTIEALDIYFLSNRLIHTCGLIAQTNFHNRLNKEDYTEMLSLLRPYFESEKFSNIPLIRIYSTVYKMLRRTEEDLDNHIGNIKELEDLLNKFKDELKIDQLKSLHSFNRSFILMELNRGKKELNNYAFKVYKRHLENKMLYTRNGIHAGNFKNTVSIGLKEKAFDWVKKFLEDYKEKIVGTDYPREVYQFNLANYYFHINEIEKAQEALSQEYEDLYYTLAAKRLEIKIYYELHSELLEYKLNAYKQFIHRLSKNKLPEIARKNNNNFINILKQILSPVNNSKIKRQRIREKIEQMDAVKDRDWLLQALD